MAEAAKNICMERLMARVTVVKKDESNETHLQAEQMRDRFGCCILYPFVVTKLSSGHIRMLTSDSDSDQETR